MLVVKGATASPFARKVIVALEEKGIPYRLEALTPVPKTPELLAMNPMGKIPILQDGDTFIPDSSVILAYLERIHPTPPLVPADAKEFARALFIEEFSDTRLNETLGPIFFERFVKPNVFEQEPDEKRVAEALAGPVSALLDQIEGWIPADRGTLLSRFSVADIAACCQLGGLPFCGVELDSRRTPKLAAYYEQIASRPSFKAAAPSLG